MKSRNPTSRNAGRAYLRAGLHAPHAPAHQHRLPHAGFLVAADPGSRALSFHAILFSYAVRHRMSNP